MNAVRKIIIPVFSLSLIYAVLRYHFFGGVEPIHFPLYVINKAIALSGFLLLLVISALPRQSTGSWPDRNMIGFISFVLIIIHAVISIIILGPGYYPKFYGTGGKMNLNGELSMFFGVAGLAFMWLVNRFYSMKNKNGIEQQGINRIRRFIFLAILSGFLHTAIMGFSGWFTPSEWHGYLPPISLVAAFGFLVWVIFLLRKERIT